MFEQVSHCNSIIEWQIPGGTVKRPRRIARSESRSDVPTEPVVQNGEETMETGFSREKETQELGRQVVSDEVREYVYVKIPSTQQNPSQSSQSSRV